MFLSDIVQKDIYVGKIRRGVCSGVGISLKSRAVKYLLCCSEQNEFLSAPNDKHDFAINVSALENVEDHLKISRLRPVFPKNCAKIFIGHPVYSDEGLFVGNVRDLEIENGIATKLYTENGVHPAQTLSACSDVILLRKEPPYPITQRIPAPVVSYFSSANEPYVSRAVLKESMQKGCLISFTLSLAPFHLPFPLEMKNTRKL